MFFATVHVRVTVLVPLVRLATRVFEPVFKADESTARELLVVPVAVPFNFQVVEQLASLGTTENVVLVEPTSDTLYVEVLGVADVTEQSFCTVNVQAHVVLSYPSEMFATMVLVPTSPPAGENVATL